MIHLRFDVTIKVVDESLLRQRATEKAVSAGERVDGMSLGRAILLLAIEPERPPKEHGFEIGRGTRVVPGDWQGSFRIVFELIAYEHEELIGESRRRRKACWQDDDWWPETLEEAAYEVLIGSSAADAPQDLGIEIIGWRHATVAAAGHAVGPMSV